MRILFYISYIASTISKNINPKKEYRIEFRSQLLIYISVTVKHNAQKERATQTVERFIGLYYGIFINKNLSRIASVKVKRNILERRNSTVNTMTSLLSDEHLQALSWEYSRDIEWFHVRTTMSHKSKP